jgi:hypothetical protein
VAADPNRRAVLAATAVIPLLVAGCRGTQALGTPPQPAPDVTRLQAAISAEKVMVHRYRDAIRLLRDGPAAGTSNEPAASATLAALLAEHQDHVRQLQARLIPGSPRAAGATLPTATASPLPAAARQAISYLASAEAAASNRLLRQLPQVPASLAQLLASISASEATHVPVLRAIRVA